MTTISPETPTANVPARFAEVVAAYGHRPAVITHDLELSYNQLNAAANRLAAAIAPGPNSPVAILAGHNAGLIVAILGVLKAGRPYVALQPNQPPARLSALLDHLQAETIVCDDEHLTLAAALAQRETRTQVLCLGRDTDHQPEHDPSVAIAPDAVAVISFTSGSTGEPKGVMRTHHNLLHRHRLDQRLKQTACEDRIALLFAASFGASQADLFGALLSGAALCLYDLHRQGIAPLSEWINAVRLTRLHLPVELFRHWLEMLPPPTFFPTLHEIAPAGRIFRRDLEKIRPHLSPGCLIVTRLASNETGLVAQMAFDVHAPITTEIIPVGRLVPDVEIALLDEAGRPLAPGPDGDSMGEIVISSPHLSLGYWRRPDLTATFFTDDPHRPGWRRYRMGDLVRVRPDGVLEFHGRRDERVKVRGYTVELGAIEAALLRLATVRNASVIAQGAVGSDKRLIAFVVPATATTAPLLRQSLASILPDYMIPASFVLLDALPLTSNGKVDRRALLDLASSSARPALPIDYVAPRNETEAKLARIWAEVLGLDAVGIHDNFLDLGGNSILAARIVARALRDRPDQSITMATLLAAPTIADIAAILPSHQHDEQLATLLAEMEAISDEEAAALLASM